MFLKLLREWKDKQNPGHPSGRRITLNAPLHQQHSVWEDRESPGWYEGPYQTVSLTVTQG